MTYMNAYDWDTTNPNPHAVELDLGSCFATFEKAELAGEQETRSSLDMGYAVVEIPSGIIPVWLTPDELANVQTAVEHHQEYLEDHGHRDYPPEDIEEIKQSYENARIALDQAGRRFFS